MGGAVNQFYIDITYKPFNPFIKVAPQFARLYGRNYNDDRGLICSGDFSLPILSDQWKSYENNNKLYGQIFDRDVRNIEVNQEIQRFKEPFSVLSGTAVGAGAGAMAGAKVGGGYGAIAGAAIGGTTGLAGGLIDISLNEKQRKEQKDRREQESSQESYKSLEFSSYQPLNCCIILRNSVLPFMQHAVILTVTSVIYATFILFFSPINLFFSGKGNSFAVKVIQ